MYARLMPTGYIVQLLTRVDLDKHSLSYAAVFGLIEDLDLHGSEYSWCTSIFYFGRHIYAPGCYVYFLTPNRSARGRLSLHISHE